MSLGAQCKHGHLARSCVYCERNEAEAALERAERALKRVEELHREIDAAIRPMPPCMVCVECGADWPCPTIQAISEERE